MKYRTSPVFMFWTETFNSKLNLCKWPLSYAIGSTCRPTCDYVQKLRVNYCKNVTFRFIRTVYKYSTKVLLSFYRLNNLKKLKFFFGLDILPRMEYDDDEIDFDS